MRFGYFFEQTIEDGYVFYQYIKIHQKRLKGEPLDYPICVRLDTNQINFSINGLERVYEKELNSEFTTTYTEHYSSRQLFSIPLKESEEIKKALKFFSEKKHETGLFPFHKEDEKEKSYINNNVISDESEIAEKSDYYSIFSGKDFTHEDISYLTFYREIFLDFLFDFFHSNLFNTHPHYKEIKTSFLSNSYYKALIFKLDCLHYDRLSKKIFNNDNHKNNGKEYYKILADKKTSATSNWINLIIEKNSGESINEDIGWFKNLESEHNKIYENNWKEKRFNRDIDLSKEAEHSIQWLINRFDLFNAGKVQIKEVFGWEGVNYLVVLVMLFFFLQLSTFPLLGNLVLNPDFLLLGRVSVFFLLILLLFIFCVFSIHVLIGIDYINPKRNKNSLLLAFPKITKYFRPKILVGSSSIWLAFLASPWIWQPNYHLNFLWGLLLVIIICLLFFFMWSRFSDLIKSSDKYGKLKRLTSRALLILSIGYLYSFGIGFILMGNTAEHKFKQDDFLKKYFLSLKKTDSNGKFINGYKYIPDTSTWRKIDSILFIQNTPVINKSEEFKSKNKIDLIYQMLSPKRDQNLKLMPYIEKVICSEGHYPFMISEDLTLRNKYLNTPINSEKEGTLISKRFIIIPNILIFYSFIALAAGIFLELGFKEKLE